MFLPSMFMPSPSVGFQFLLPIKPLSLKLPFDQRLEIEIFGRIVPDAESRSVSRLKQLATVRARKWQPASRHALHRVAV